MATEDTQDGRGKLAVVTGASSGIGLELAKCCAQRGYDLLIAADEPEIADVEQQLSQYGVDVKSLETDLADLDGVDELYDALEGRPVDLLLANAGHGLGHAFLDQDFDDVRHVIDTNVTGTIYLAHRIGQDMRSQGSGRILFTGSIAGFMPGSFQAVYNASKAFVDSFAAALRNELKDTGVTVSCLMPGATDTNFFARADMLDTDVGSDHDAMSDPAEVARAGFEAMLKGEDHVVVGMKNKMEVAATRVMSDDMLAERHRKMAAPGTAKH